MAEDSSAKKFPRPIPNEAPKPTSVSPTEVPKKLKKPTRPQAPLPDLGALLPFMEDPNVTEIMVNDLRNIMIETHGRVSLSGVTIPEMDELHRIVRNILEGTGRVINADTPYADVRLPDGSRVNIVSQPLTLYGPCITIRKFPVSYSAKDLMNFGSFDQKIGYFLNCCVLGRKNILVSGGTGSGKTTFLNALVSFIPRSERLVTIEDTPEIELPQENSVQLQTKPKTPSSPPILARDLVANALRMRPDRIIVGECRREEALDMLQAMNTGHDGSMTTIHANSPRDALSRMETLCMMARDLPLLAIRQQMTSAIDLIVQVKRFRDGKRRVVAISEITGMEGEIITLQDIFGWHLETKSFRATGYVPTFLESLRENGINLQNNLFS